MSIQALDWVFNHSRSTFAARLVLMAIANHADTGAMAWPSTATIADEANVDRATVFRSLPTLVELGELEIIARGRGRGVRNTYCLKGWLDATLNRHEKVASDNPNNGSQWVAGCDPKVELNGRIYAEKRSHWCDTEPSVTVSKPNAREDRATTTDPKGSSSPSPSTVNQPRAADGRELPQYTRARNTKPEEDPRPMIKFPERCPRCDHLGFDCLCDRGPTIAALACPNCSQPLTGPHCEWCGPASPNGQASV